MEFFRNALLENFQKLHFGLEFPEFLNPKKIPRICRENWAILEKLRDSFQKLHFGLEFPVFLNQKKCSPANSHGELGDT